jgi:hypothetical protein
MDRTLLPIGQDEGQVNHLWIDPYYTQVRMNVKSTNLWIVLYYTQVRMKVKSLDFWKFP